MSRDNEPRVARFLEIRVYDMEQDGEEKELLGHALAFGVEEDDPKSVELHTKTLVRAARRHLEDHEQEIIEEILDAQ